jgi:hypothetical protein
MTNGVAEKFKYGTSQLLDFTRDSYLERTSRPIYALLFLLPFIVFYEIGTIFINTDVLNQSQVRVVAFVWLQNMLEEVGFSDKSAWIAPPVAVVIILLALQMASKKKWYFNAADIGPMVVECILLAVPLIVLSLFLHSSADGPNLRGQYGGSAINVRTEAVISCASKTGAVAGGVKSPSRFESIMADAVTGVGAGIYEELIFRLVLICFLMMLFQDFLRMGHSKAIILSVLVSAALFSAHHHIIFLNGRFGQSMPFNWTEFWFRTMAGIYFAVLFAIRGFGITAGTHAFYDIIAVCLNTIFFKQ